LRKECEQALKDIPLKSASKLALLGLTLLLSACAALEGDKVDYKSAAKAAPLSIPPDLTQLPRDTRYTTPGTTVSARPRAIPWPRSFRACASKARARNAGSW
jgi:outer membrane protein assembly factor BamC